MPILGFDPEPGRIEFWQTTFTVTDFTARTIHVRTRTTAFSVWTEIHSAGHPDPRIVTEGRIEIEVVPAPAGLALLGLGGLAAARRRRGVNALLEGEI